MFVAEPIQIGMYRRSLRSPLRSHWITGGAIACKRAEAGLQCVRPFPAVEVAVMPALCRDCREQLLAKRMIQEPKKA